MKFLDWAFNDNSIVQLTHQVEPYKNSRWVHGHFDDVEKLRYAAKLLNKKGGNVFVSLNRPFPCEVTNMVNSNTGFKREDIERVTRIFIDLDPEREGYMPSTDLELDLALRQMHYAQDYFRAMGWTRPARAISGSGCHLLFRTIMPNNTETQQMMTTILNGLKDDLSTDAVKLDTAVSNPNRIHPVYGAIKRKGDPTDERPYRQTRIWIPDQWQQVQPQQLEKLANHYARKNKAVRRPQPASTGNFSGNGDYSTLDAVALFHSHGLYLSQTPEAGKHWVTCPWKDEHSGTGPKDTVLWDTSTSGWPTFHCSHDHCADRTLIDVIQLLGDADRFCAKEYAR